MIWLLWLKREALLHRKQDKKVRASVGSEEKEGHDEDDDQEDDQEEDSEK